MMTLKLPGTITLVLEDTPEKFRPLAEEIVPPLIELLRGLCALEEKFCARGQKQRAERPGGIYSTQAHPNSKALWDYYRDQKIFYFPLHPPVFHHLPPISFYIPEIPDAVPAFLQAL